MDYFQILYKFYKQYRLTIISLFNLLSPTWLHSEKNKQKIKFSG